MTNTAEAQTFKLIDSGITAPHGASTYLHSRVAMDTRNRWAQDQRPGSSWTFVVTRGGTVVASHGGFATHGEAVAAMYQARPEDFTSVTRIDSDQTHWDTYEATPPRPGYGKGRTGPVVGHSMVILVDSEPSLHTVHSSTSSSTREYIMTIKYPANAERSARRAGANAENARLYDEYVGRCFYSEIQPMPAAMWLEHTTKLVTLR